MYGLSQAETRGWADPVTLSLIGVGTFGIFLFLTCYLQQTLGYTPVKSGLAFLPMIDALVAVSTLAPGQIAPRVGPRLIVPPGMAVTAAGWRRPGTSSPPPARPPDGAPAHRRRPDRDRPRRHPARRAPRHHASRAPDA